MMQLWLANGRIDSVEKLRAAFAARDAEAQRALCVELLEKMSADIFIPWLGRCGETCAPNSDWERERAAAVGAGTLEPCRLQLERERDVRRLSDAGVAALAEVCEIDEATVRAALAESCRHARRCCPAEDLRRRIERQAWYVEDAAVRRMFAGIRWDRVAVDSSTLRAILSLASGQAGAGRTDVYLCNVGEAFTLRAPGRLRNLRLVGFGAPAVQFDPLARGERLDMVEQNLKFERFRLNCQGVELCHAESCCCEMKIV